MKIRTKITTVPKPPPPVANGQPHGEPKAEEPNVEPKAEEPNVEQRNGDLPPSEQPNGQPPTVAPTVEQTNDEPAPSNDVEMKEAPAAAEEAEEAEEGTDGAKVEAQDDVPQLAPKEIPSEAPQEIEDETTETYEDDHWSMEGAVYPIKEGRIDNWSCFFALISHIYKMMSPPFHMPVLFVAQPCWSARDHEMITQYCFENWQIPAFCLMDAALMGIYAYGVPTALVVDVGQDKCDVTAVTEYQVNDIGRGIAIPGCGGRSMTKRLQQVLESQGFDEAMAEQLKKSPICEILPAGVAYPQGAAALNDTAVVNPAAAASTGALDSGMNAKDVDGLRPGQAPRGPGMGTIVGEEPANGDDEENDGVLDVAAIVARDNAAELLAKREKERAEKAAAKKGGAVDAVRPLRLRNSERERASFAYVDFVPLEQSNDEVPQSRKRKREMEVGVERFMAATPPPGVSDGIIDSIAEAVHHTVLSVPDISMRSQLWENLIVLGNGSRIRGWWSYPGPSVCEQR